MRPITIQTRLRLALLLIASVMFVGAAGFHFIEGWSWFDGIYMTLITMTTVGYGEIHPLSQTGKVFNTFLILASVMAGGFLVASFTQAMLEFEFGKFFGRRRLERELAKLRDHYIICGAGRVGRTVARQFRASNVPFVIIEKDPAHAQWAVDEGLPIIIGNATNEEVLRQGRIEHAKGLVAAVASDPENLYIVLTASGMCSGLKIIARASEEEAIPKLLRAGAWKVLSPYHFIGHRIAQLFLRPHVLDFIDTAFDIERIDIQIEEIHVPPSSTLAGKTLADTDIRQRTGVLVLALKKADGTMNFSPAPDAVVHPGDCLIGIGRPDDLRKLESLASS